MKSINKSTISIDSDIILIEDKEESNEGRLRKMVSLEKVQQEKSQSFDSTKKTGLDDQLSELEEFTPIKTILSRGGDAARRVQHILEQYGRVGAGLENLNESSKISGPKRTYTTTNNRAGKRETNLSVSLHQRKR